MYKQIATVDKLFPADQTEANREKNRQFPHPGHQNRRHNWLEPRLDLNPRIARRDASSTPATWTAHVQKPKPETKSFPGVAHHQAKLRAEILPGLPWRTLHRVDSGEEPPDGFPNRQSRHGRFHVRLEVRSAHWEDEAANGEGDADDTSSCF